MPGHASEAPVEELGEVRPDEELDPAPVVYQNMATQYGVRMPDGTELWAIVTITVRYNTVEVEPVQTTPEGRPFHGLDLASLERERYQAVPGPATAAFRDMLWGLASAAYVDVDAYAGQVTLVYREVGLSVDTVSRAVPAVDLLERLD